jgi:UDP-glucose 4-epimerase
MQQSRYGVVNWFIRLALDGATIPVFGDGRILRDFLYVDDCVRAIMMCAADEKASGQKFNVGVDEPHDFRELAELIVEIAGQGRWELTPFSEERKAQEPGDFYSDISKIEKFLGWRPTTTLAEGLKQTIEYYKANRAHYW